MDLTVAAFYRFIRLSDLGSLRAIIVDACQGAGVRGTILIAEEGVNGTIAGTGDGVSSVLSMLAERCGVVASEVKYSSAKEWPFPRLKVRLRPEIITMRDESADPTVRVGRYVEAKDWNEVVRDPGVVLIDTRNSYETAVGTFEGALDPAIENFTDFKTFVEEKLDPQVQGRVAMFCTGGIRCEKASAYMLAKGFKDVVHLKGGILKYLEDVSPSDSMWRGDCYVFDSRVAVGPRLAATDWTACHGCGHPLTPEDRQDGSFEEGVSCRHCIDRLTREKAASLRERQRQMSA